MPINSFDWEADWDRTVTYEPSHGGRRIAGIADRQLDRAACLRLSVGAYSTFGCFHARAATALTP